MEVLLIGYDHSFGSDRLKGFSEYEHLGKQIGLRVLRAYECLVDSLPVSSSRIRKLLAAAQIDQVNRLLGYAYSISGVVEHGNAIGATLGFPTANIHLSSAKQLPASGVYSVVAQVDGVEYKYKNVWIATSMNGRYFGGGMKVAPMQERDSDLMTVVVLHNLSRWKILTILPKVFDGSHVKYKQYFVAIKGKEVEVEYDIPQDVQIDGEVIRGVTRYSAVKETAKVTE